MTTCKTDPFELEESGHMVPLRRQVSSRRRDESLDLRANVMIQAIAGLPPFDLLLLALWVAVIVAPIAISWRQRSPISLGIVVGLLFGYLVQLLWIPAYRLEWTQFSGGPFLIFATNPALMGSIGWWPTLLTAGFLHHPVDPTHVLGNVLILALVGVPLEQRMGSGRYVLVYLISILGGSLGWVIANLGENQPALGASGAAFGLLGAYLACYPRDEIPFPLLLIRPWPVSFIALIYLGIEIVRAYSVYGFGDVSDVAHIAHIKRFFAAYAVSPTIARNAPVPPGQEDGTPTSAAGYAAVRKGILARMGSLDEDPWALAGTPLEGAPGRTLKRLREEGDEIETRQAWLERLAEEATCPVCSGALTSVEDRGATRIRCVAEGGHLRWP